jgi:hypothetical protein
MDDPPAGNATYLRPYEDDRILFNLSVWETVEHLQQYVYRTAHAELIRQRKDWFAKFAGAYVALWWVAAGHIPDVEEAKTRLAHFEAHGPSPLAFTFATRFAPGPDSGVRSDEGGFEPRPAATD